MTDRDLLIITRLVEIAPPLLDRFYYPDRCVAATKEGLAALEYFGIHARAVKTQCYVGNLAWHDWIEKGAGVEMPEEAYSVGIDLETPNPGRYAGHLCILVDDEVLIDLSLGQFSRPEHRMAVPPARAFRLRDGVTQAFWIEDTVVVYKLLPERDWTTTPGWQRKPLAAGQIIRKLRGAV